MRDYEASLQHNTHNSSLLQVSKTEITAETKKINAAHILQDSLQLWTMHLSPTSSAIFYVWMHKITRPNCLEEIF